jgi:restriction endonuclease S subunit
MSSETTPPLRGTPPREGNVTTPRLRRTPPGEGNHSPFPQQSKPDTQFPSSGGVARSDGVVVPKLRFPEFGTSDDWQTKLLGSLCKIRTGKKDANDGASDGQYPFFTCAENHIFSNSHSFDAEAILIAGNANVGQTRYYCGKFEAYQRTYVLTDFSGISVPYLYTVLNAKLRESLLAQVQVSAMSYIKLPMLQEYALAVPPSLPEQQKIAECLSSVDELMAAQARKVDALKTHKKGLMQNLFPREGETHPRLRFPEFQNTGEWAEGRLADIATVLQGYGFPERHQGQTSGDYPFYKVSDISRSFASGKVLIEESANYINEGLLKELRAKPIPEGTTIFAKIGEAIRSNKRAITTVPCLIDNNAAGVKRIKGKATDLFIYLLMEQISLIDHAGGVVPAVNKSAIEEISVKFPELDEQECIASCMSNLDTLITAETQKLDALKTHKKGLMQQLFPSVGGVAGEA